MSSTTRTTSTGYASISTSGNAGGGASHNHTASASVNIPDHKHIGGTISVNSHNHVFTGNNLNMAIKYCDVIVAEKE